MKPIVFLDIDGVLNTDKEYGEWNAAHNELQRQQKEGYNDRWLSVTKDPHVRLLFGAPHVQVLNRIVRDSGAAIVVSSSWRQFYGNTNFPSLRVLLEDVGVEGEVLGPTPVHIGDRYPAVWAWLHEHRKGQTAHFVCLDDDDPGFRNRDILPHVCLIDPSKGLRDEDYTRALKKLSRGRKIT